VTRATPTKHLPYHRLLEQLAQPGCALCLLVSEAARRILETLHDEQLLDPDRRVRLRASLGFCPPHARQAAATAPRLSTAILYEDFLRRAEEELEAWTRLRRPPEPGTPCPVCAAAQREEEAYVRVMAAYIDDPAMASAYERSTGLCLRHTLHLCRRLKEPARRRIVAHERVRLQRLRAELSEVIRKHDYRFRGEPWGEERSAPDRAVAKLTGEGPIADREA
jgi:hypothetical protein